MSGSAIALTGYGTTSAAGSGLDAHAACWRSRRSHVRRLPDEVVAQVGMKLGARFCDATDHGDGSPADRLEPAARRALGEALRMAGCGPRERDGMSLRIGTALAGVEWFEREAAAAGVEGPCDPDEGYTAAELTGRLACAEELTGPTSTFSATCVSSLYALEQACLDVATGRAARAVCGGLDSLSRFMQTGFHALGALHDEGEDDGLILGEAACFLVLEPLEAARARGATVHGILAGRALRADAYHLTAPDESGRGMVDAVRACLAEADVRPTDVDQVSLTADGSRRYRAMYDAVLAACFGDGAPATVSWEPLLGHVLAASGVFGIAHAALRRAQGERADTVLALTVGFGGQNGAHLLCAPSAEEAA